MARNKKLFAALERQFGRGQVKIVRPNQKLLVKYVPTFGEDGEVVKKMTRVNSGEEYQIRCPVCRDHKQRLSISHRWGEIDKETGRLNLWLMQCWNEQCFADFAARKAFYERLYGDGKQELPADDSAEYDTDDALIKRGKPKMPGKLWRIDRLAVKSPQHAAVLYVKNRLLDLQELGELFGVGYCPDPERFAARNRLIAPVVFEGRLAGWTGRFIEAERSKRIPKWFHDPNMEKSQLLYNFDAARSYHTRILVEGPGDVWGCGVRGLGALGKTLSEAQIKLLAGLQALQGSGPLAVMLDPTQDKVSKEKGLPHHLERALGQLRAAGVRDVFPVYLPPTLDPGAADRGLLFSLVRSVAARFRLQPDFEATV